MLFKHIQQRCTGCQEDAHRMGRTLPHIRRRLEMRAPGCTPPAGHSHPFRKRNLKAGGASLCAETQKTLQAFVQGNKSMAAQEAQLKMFLSL